ncbi:cobalamin biosynthesis protein [Methylomonas sp. LL1]|uniref:adenosylcobinamide-phosphate synthase CbiB n=1 Tax=Methylomonas sp. LL1 TaxID=2785785 RepID=UPI0018C353CF|nr:adenosylcobinamide-phosphate synthase CbiB [Methylomonas sp. LL1]QPK62829.1 cobalamin biosynthesis protein [Methylomonas sp. LL1]
MTLTLTVVLALLLDHWLGEPRATYHPLVKFGRWAGYLEHRLLKPADSENRQRTAGIAALLCALIPCLIWLPLLPRLSVPQAVISVAILYFCIAARSLEQHAIAVFDALDDGNLPLARQRVGYIVSRQTEHMTADDTRRASIESVLENGADAVFAPLFWFILLGPIGALLYRLGNTLDAMWGYKNARYRHFGWAAARLDDLLNWIPARLTALSYVLLGHTAKALTAWRTQAHLLDSPNAGPVMTAGGGALNLQLGGPAVYHGRIKQKPWFGGDQVPEDADIARACALMYRTLFLWLIVIGLGDLLA